MASKSSVPHAAVLLALFNDGLEDHLLLTRRATTLREHAGEVAFPGGKRESADRDLYQTALRECYEEVGIEMTSLEYVDRLVDHSTRAGALVSPFVARLDKAPELRLNEAEIASAFWVPVSVFKEDRRSFTHIFKVAQAEYWAPVYHYDGYEIWGFTARVLVSFANAHLGTAIGRRHLSAPERVFRP